MLLRIRWVNVSLRTSLDIKLPQGKLEGSTAIAFAFDDPANGQIHF